ncbi:MAG: pilus assembly protein [Bryobacterales bacterium]|nr:pilus assembly protein [Bryobacterales bacterium]
MNSQKGHAMIELAISATVMVTFLAGTFQFGYTFYIYNQLVSAVGNGARYAAQRTYRGATDRDIERGNQAIRNLVVYGDAQPAADAAPVIANLKPEHVEVRWVLNGDGIPATVDVTIRGFAVDAAIQTFAFDGRPSVEFPYVGRYAPAESEP